MRILFHPSFNGNYPVKVGLPVCNSIEKSSNSNFLSLKSERLLSTPNTGNLVHLEAPSRMFAFDVQKSTRSNLFDLLKVFKGNTTELKKFIEEHFDAVVISEANFITPTEASNQRCHTLAGILENLKVKLFLFGAGMQRPLPSNLDAAGEGVSKFLQVLNEQATLFCVRGHETEKWLHQCGIDKAIALGCPSFYVYPKKIVDIKLSELWNQETMLLSAGYLQDKRRTKILSEAIKDIQCHYVFQNDLFTVLNNFDNIKGFYDQATGKLSKSIINQAVESLIGLFPPFKDYFIFQDTRSWRQFCAWHNLYFGDRLHGGVIAMQAGVPAIFIYDDLRVKELIDFFQLPGYSVNQVKEKTLQQLYLNNLNSGGWENFILAYKKRLKAFVETCKSVGLIFQHDEDIHQALAEGNKGDSDQVFQYQKADDPQPRYRQAIQIRGCPTRGDDSQFLDDHTFYLKGVNTGNMAFSFAVLKQIEGIKYGGIPSQPKPDSSVIIAASNMLGKHCNMGSQVEKLEQSDLPVVAIGLGAQSSSIEEIPKIPYGTVEWVKHIRNSSISDKANISVRGMYTYKVLKALGLDEGVEILGCPTLFINPEPALGNMIATKKLNKLHKVATGTTGFDEEKIDLYLSLAEIAQTTVGGYICQHPEDHIKLARSEGHTVDQKSLDKIRQFINPNFSLDEVVIWFKRYAFAFHSIPAWMNYYKTVDMYVGTRIHGTMLALQTGIPALCITIDSRTEELCQLMKVPYVSWQQVKDGITIDLAREIFNEIFVPEEFDQNRSELCQRYIRFLEGNRLKPSKFLYEIAQA